MAGETTLFDRFGCTFDAGALIFREGEIGDQMYIIQRGKIRISKRIGNKDHILAILEKGDFFGEMAIVTRAKRTASAVALDQVQLLAFDREGFQSMITKNARIALNIIDKLCQRLANANLQIQRLVRKNARALVALNLLYAFQVGGWEAAELRYDRTTDEIALGLELSKEALRGHMEALEREGVISVQGNSIRLLVRSRLETIAEFTAAREG